MVWRSMGHAATIYIVIILVMRILGKRHIGDMQPSELVLTLLIADLAAVSIQDPDQPLTNGIASILVVMAINFILSLGFLKSRLLWRVFEGKAAILVDKGRLCEKAMRSNRITLNELFEMLRLQGYTDLSQLRYAILESSGKLSVIPYEAHKPMTPTLSSVTVDEPGMPDILISDGKVMKKKLQHLGLSEQWLKTELSSRGFGSIEDTFIFTRDECGRVYYVPKEKKPNKSAS